MKTAKREMKLRIRRYGGSLTVIIPKDIANLYGIDEGDELELIPVGRDELNFVFKKRKT